MCSPITVRICRNLDWSVCEHKRNTLQYFILLACNNKSKFSLSSIVLERAYESVNFSSLHPLSNLLRHIENKTCWLDNQPTYCVGLQFYITYDFLSDSTTVHLMFMCQLHNDERCRWVCVYCWERAKQSIHQPEILLFNRHAYNPGSAKWTQRIYTAQRGGRIFGCLICKTVTLNHALGHITTRRMQRINCKPKTPRIY